MKRIALMFALFFVVALVFPAEAPAPITTTTIPEPCGDGVWDPAVEECDYTADPTGCDEYEVCTMDCICEPVDPCGDGVWDPAVEECDYTADPTGCDENEVCTDDCICEPMGGGEGCTPGFWKQPAVNWGYWPAPYTPDTMFCDVFECAFDGMTLLEVLNQGGGGLYALGRHAVAALLNAVSPGVDYALSAQNVIDMFNGVYPDGDKEDYNDLKDMFEDYNTDGCPLSRENPPPVGPDPECVGATCATFIPCNPDSGCIAPVCGTTTEGGGVCVEGATPCDALPDCTTSADCGDGWCFVDSCCVRNVCQPASNRCESNGASAVAEVQAVVDGPTFGSR